MKYRATACSWFSTFFENAILALQAEYPSAHVILVSGDINIQNKADAALIETIEGP
jgi:predicted ribonuclease YlaK